MEKVEFAEELKGPRVILKRHPVTREHAEQMFEMFKRNEDLLKEYMGGHWPFNTHSADDLYGFLEFTKKAWEEKIGFEYMILVGGEHVGNIGLMHINFEDENFEIGYWMDRKHARNGYMQEAVEVVEKYVFGELGFNRIKIGCVIHNVASRGLIEKLGYRYDGIDRGYVKLEGEFQDVFNYSKLQSEWISSGL